MAVTKPKSTTPADQGCVVLIVPCGTGRSHRIVVPHEVANWLRAELCATLAPGKVSKRPRHGVEVEP